MRGSAASEVITPGDPPLTFAFGNPKATVFVRLNASARNCSLIRSVMTKLRETETSRYSKARSAQCVAAGVAEHAWSRNAERVGAAESLAFRVGARVEPAIDVVRHGRRADHVGKRLLLSDIDGAVVGTGERRERTARRVSVGSGRPGSRRRFSKRRPSTRMACPFRTAAHTPN